MKKEIIEQLEEKFSAKDIKKRPGSFGKTLDYVEAHRVVQRLNKAFNHDWSFHILKQDLINNYVITHGQICVKIDGVEVCKAGIGGKKLAKTKEFPGKPSDWLDIGNDYKASSMDSLKKCATLFGVALDLYGTDEDEKDEPVAVEVKEDGPIKPTQVSAITKMAGDKLKEILVENKVDSLEKLTESQAKGIIVKLNEKK